MTREEVIDRMQPYNGEHVKGVDTDTLIGKVMCGYQGWFAAEGDGSSRRWFHYAAQQGRFEPGYCTFDLWPDMADMDEDEKYPTPFVHVDGSTAFLFSPYNRKTVVRHFDWMERHGIDGVFLQRFGVAVKEPRRLNHRNVVTSNVQAGANLHGRTWAMMYDLSGLKPGAIKKWVMEDWKLLIDRMKIREDRAYLCHEGKPMVAVWGMGFSDGRKYSLEECEQLVRFLKEDPEYGGNTVMLGLPTHWRTLTRDAVADRKLHAIVRLADIVSPWMVGRYKNPGQVRTHAKTIVAADIEWCSKNGMAYLPVAFPGFSWQNLKKSRGSAAELGAIPRRGGEFLWAQGLAFAEAGAKMLYVAMFDEVDEGTAIFKCSNNPPVGKSSFLTYEGLPSDHYLWLTGKLGSLLRGEIPGSQKLPVRDAMDISK